ncbi:MAG: cupin domain-containing protein [Ornithinimicrobium sp.]
MTSDVLTGRVRADSSALTRLLSCSLDTFASEHWATSAKLSTYAERGEDDFGDLFSLQAVDELLGRRGLRTPFIRMAKNGKTLPESAYTVGGGVGAGVGDQVSDDKVLGLFADGATVVLQGLHRTWDPIVRWSQDLAGVLGHPVQVNAYVTPAQNQGFADHYDVHDVFVLQIHGQKRWSIHEPVLDAPLRDQPWADRRDEVEAAAALPPAIDATLSPGDCLYLPRGFIHSATALGGVSIHLTVGVHGWTRHHLAEALLTSARSGLGLSPQVRASLPLGVDVSDVSQISGDVETARAELIRAIQTASTDEIAAIMTGRSRAAQRPETVSAVGAAAALSELTCSDTLRLRKHLMLQHHRRDAGDEVVVRSRAGRFVLPTSTQPALELLLTGDPVVVADLHADPETALEVARTFVRNGVATSPGPTATPRSRTT